MSYNGLDQLTHVEGAGEGVILHGYGFDGQRIGTQNADGDAQVWFTPNLTVRDGELEHIVRVGDRILARLTLGLPPPPGGGSCAIVLPPKGRWTTGTWLGVSLAGLLLGLVIAWRPRWRRRRWARTLAALAAVAAAVSACSVIGSTSRPVWIVTDARYFHYGVAPGPILFTRSDGSVFAERRYEPFGEEIDAIVEDEESRTSIEDVDFAREAYNALNKESDPDTGWSYHGARWMAPETARWLSPDPPVKGPHPKFMTMPWGLHPYQYVEQNPMLYLDPDGRDVILFYVDDDAGEKRKAVLKGLEHDLEKTFGEGIRAERVHVIKFSELDVARYEIESRGRKVRHSERFSG